MDLYSAHLSGGDELYKSSINPFTETRRHQRGRGSYSKYIKVHDGSDTDGDTNLPGSTQLVIMNNGSQSVKKGSDPGEPPQSTVR